MYKKIIKGVLVCVSVAFFSLVMAYITYFTATNIINRSLSDRNSSENTAEAVLSDTMPNTAEPSSTPFDSGKEYYLARLSGDRIEIYSCINTDENTEKSERFLYSFSVYLPDIPNDDAGALKQGIRLNTKEELASLEEDFNS